MNISGKVIQSTGSWYLVDTGEDIISCRLPGKFRQENSQLTNKIAIGDIVFIEKNEDGSGSILNIQERENGLPRQATHGRRGEQLLVANVDVVFIVQSVHRPALKEGLIDRMLVSCDAYHVQPAVIVNKSDLAKTPDNEILEELADLYTSLGYPFFVCSAETGDGLEEIRAFIKAKTTAFIGPSGVGKTSLINALIPNQNLRIGEISDYSNKGKHTTTVARLIPVPEGGYIADTPGIREFGIVGIEPWELSLYFPEMIIPRKNCKFNTCTHDHEPNCGVESAHAAGKIADSRYRSYLNILDSLKNRSER